LWIGRFKSPTSRCRLRIQTRSDLLGWKRNVGVTPELAPPSHDDLLARSIRCSQMWRWDQFSSFVRLKGKSDDIVRLARAVEFGSLGGAERKLQSRGDRQPVRVGACPHPTGFVLLLRTLQLGKLPRSPLSRGECLFSFVIRRVYVIGAFCMPRQRWTERGRQLRTALPLWSDFGLRLFKAVLRCLPISHSTGMRL